MRVKIHPRQVLRWLWVNLLAGSGCLWWVKNRIRSQGAVIGLVFHRVLRDEDCQRTHSQPEIRVQERTFRELAAYVARNYEAHDLHEVVPGARSRKLKVVFTFDDGWWDNCAVALPITRAYNIPLTIFLCPHMVDKNMPFWPERAIALLHASEPGCTAGQVAKLIEDLKRQLPQAREQALAKLAEAAHQPWAPSADVSVDRTLSWEQISEMDRAGVRFGSHTHSHEILTNVPIDTARQQIEGTGAAIEQKLSKPCVAFSYPNGNWSETVRDVVATAGFKLAVTTDRKIWTTETDPLAIPRSNVYEQDLVGLDGRFSAAMFEYVTIWKPWRRSKLKRRMPTPALHKSMAKA